MGKARGSALRTLLVFCLPLLLAVGVAIFAMYGLGAGSLDDGAGVESGRAR